MPAIVPARNTLVTHYNSAVCPFSEIGVKKMEDTRDIDFVTFEIWVLVLAALLLALMTIEWILFGA